MKFDVDSYDAQDTYKIISENCYKCLIKPTQESKEGVVAARLDWHISNITPDSYETELFWITSLEKNQKFKELCVSVSNQTFYEWPYEIETKQLKNLLPFKASMLCGVYKKDTDEFLGFSVEKVLYQYHWTLFTCFLPEHRSKGYSTEIGIAGAKYIFNTCDYQMSESRITMKDSENSKLMDMALSFDPEDREIIDRGYSEKYGKILIDREGFNSWLLENPEWKNSYYSYEQLFATK